MSREGREGGEGFLWTKIFGRSNVNFATTEKLTIQLFDMAQPNPEAFARAVLWHLAGLRAEVASLHVQLHDLQEAAGRPIAESFVKECVERDRSKQKELYLEACEEARIDPDLESM